MNVLRPFTSRLTAHPKLLVSALAVAAPIAYLSYLHYSLAQTTSHVRSSGPLTRAAVSDISSVPSSVLGGEYRMVRDRAWKRVPKEEMPRLGGEEMLKLYLRETMGLFAKRFPQAYLLRVVAQGGAKTFEKEYIDGCTFAEGEVVAGVYKVVKNEGGEKGAKVEFEMVMAKEKREGAPEGRLVVGGKEVGDEWEWWSETVMWIEDGGKMPLEKKTVGLLHEVAAWWLLGRGVSYLQGLKKAEDKAE
ncbi:hypothetical protein V495_03835 [Pseudogymnoascus sp. VKM F-4514 (FW-929)]|nr:hypothetical protein V495_03835 [Pseudogymnoascus sp. VKM F-4514 (FW-929)]KFY60344.1 hypothetical protein V497_03701 [Pseudogymnoascus sp. VKM F-4516 (FW-969)]